MEVFFFAMHVECCFSDNEDVEGRVVDEDDDCEMMMILMMMCSGFSLRCTVSVVSQTMKMSKVVLLMKMMIV